MIRSLASASLLSALRRGFHLGPALGLAVGFALGATSCTGAAGGPIEGKGTAGSPKGGVVTVQGDPAATPLPVTLQSSGAPVNVQGAGGGAVPVSGAVDVNSVVGVVSVQPASGSVQVVNGPAPSGGALGNPFPLGARVGSPGPAALQPTVGGGALTQLNADGEGRLEVRADHPNAFWCRSSTTVTAGTNALLCAASTAALATYITDLQIQVTTSNAGASFAIGHAAGGTCANPSTQIYDCVGTAVGTCTMNLHTPIRIDSTRDLCVTGVGSTAQARFYVGGYHAP